MFCLFEKATPSFIEEISCARARYCKILCDDTRPHCVAFLERARVNHMLKLRSNEKHIPCNCECFPFRTKYIQISARSVLISNHRIVCFGWSFTESQTISKDSLQNWIENDEKRTTENDIERWETVKIKDRHTKSEGRERERKRGSNGYSNGTQMSR